MNLDFMRQCVASCSKEVTAEVQGQEKRKQESIRKASSLDSWDSIRHITIQVNNFNNKRDFTYMLGYVEK